MEFFETVNHRHSIRRFRNTEIEREKLDQVLAAFMSAPSAGDLQAYRVYLVTSEDRRQKLANASFNQSFIADAPAVLVFCAEPTRSAQKYGPRGRELYSVQDATIACSYAQLAATAEGLGSTWVGAFDPEAVRQAVNIDTDHVPVAILPIGYPAEVPARTPRRSLPDVVQQV